MRTRLLTLLLLTSIFLFACSNDKTVVEKNTEPSTNTEGQVTVEENILTVNITIPKEWLGDETITQDSLNKERDEKGFDTVLLNQDGSVSYKVSKLKHAELLKEMQNDVKKTCDSMINGENAVKSFQRIEFNDSITEFSIYVDKTLFSEFDTFMSISFYLSGGYYQLFNCVPSAKVDVIVNYIDQDTNEVLSSGKLSDMKDQNAEQPTPISTESDLLSELQNWYTGDIWNSFIDFQAYRASGKDCTGSDIDIEFAYQEFKDAYDLKQKYSDFVSSLSDEYAKLKEVWEKMDEQIEIIYADLESNGVAEGGPNINLDLLSQYSNTFYDTIN